MNKTYRLVVFDWDGTLMDSAAEIIGAMQAAIADIGMENRSDGAIRNIIGLGLYEAIAALYPEAGEHDYTRVVDRYRYHFLADTGRNSQLFPGVEQLLAELSRQGYFLAVATGKSRRGLNRSLSQVGLERLFHSTRCADETRSKPHPQMLHEIMDELGAEPAQTLVVGDTEYDLQMASNAGAHSLAVSYGAHDKARLLSCAPVACLDNVQDLHAWFVK